jgi:hypothetical protein
VVQRASPTRFFDQPGKIFRQPAARLLLQYPHALDLAPHGIRENPYVWLLQEILHWGNRPWIAHLCQPCRGLEPYLSVGLAIRHRVAAKRLDFVTRLRQDQHTNRLATKRHSPDRSQEKKMEEP